MKCSELRAIVRSAATSWVENGDSSKAASLAYYALLSLAPLLMVAVSVTGLLLGDEAARGSVAKELRAVVGPVAAQSVEAIIRSAHAPQGRLIGTLVGLTTSLVGASGVFNELQLALNHIWGVRARSGRGLLGIVKDRLFSFAMVLGVSLLLFLLLMVSTIINAIERFLPSIVGGSSLLDLVNLGVSFGMTTLLWALVLRIIPDAKVAWRDVWVGALVAAFLFTLGKSAIGYYLGTSSISSSYGAAGSLVALIIWVYYTAQILFFGAELSKASALRCGDPIEPRRDAVREPERSAPGSFSPTGPTLV